MTIPPQCVDSCRKEGRCYLYGSYCIATSDALCAQSWAGRMHGRTTVVEGLCVATTIEGCARSRRCEDDGQCFPEEGRCVERIRSKGMRAGGIVAMSLGGAALVAGLSVMLLSLPVSEDEAIIAGTLLGNGALSMFAVGLPLVVIGSHEYRPGDPEVEQLSLQLTLTGAALSMSF